MEDNKKKKTFSWLRFLIRSLFAFSVFLGLLSFALTRSYVQTQLAKMATTYLKNNLQIDASLSKIKINLPNKIEIRDLVLLDDYKDTIIASKKIDIQIASISRNFQNLSISRIGMDYSHFYLLTREGDAENGFMTFLHKLSSGDKETTDSEDSFKLKIAEVDFKNFHFRRQDFGNDELPVFDVKDGRILIKDFSLNGMDISAYFEKMSGYDKKYFKLHLLRGNVGMTEQSIYLNNLKGRTDKSRIDADISLDFKSFEDFEDFSNLVKLYGDFHNSHFNLAEIQSLLPVFPSLDNFTLDGLITGTLNQLESKSFDFQMGKSLKLFGQIEMKDLIDTLSPLHFDVGLSYLKGTGLEMSTLFRDFLDSSSAAYMNSIGNFQFNGTYRGTLEQFASKGNFRSDMGNVDYDAQVNLSNIYSYKIDAKVEKINLGKILDIKEIGYSSGDIKVEGVGNKLANLNVKILGNIHKIEALGYPYQKIKVNGKLSDRRFLGDINIQDPNLVFAFQGEASLGSPDYLLDFQAKLEKANLYALKLLDDPEANLNFTLNSALRSNKFEDLVGDLLIEDISYNSSKAHFHTSEIILSALKLGNDEVITLKSDFVDGIIKGNYSLASLHESFTHWIYNQNSLQEDKKSIPNNEFEYQFNLKNITNLVQLFNDDIHFYSGGTLTGIVSGVDSTFKHHVDIGNVRYKDYIFKNIDLNWEGIDFSSSKLEVKLTDLYSENIKIDSVELFASNSYDSLNFNLSWTWIDSLGSRGNISGHFKQLTEGHFNLSFEPSSFKIGKETFDLVDGNQIDFYSDAIYIENLMIQNRERSIAVNGAISGNEYEILRISVHNFGIDLFNVFLVEKSFKVQGVMEGEIILSNITNNLQFASDLEIDSLIVNDQYQGDLMVNSDWQLGYERILIDSYLKRGTLKTMELSGTYAITDEHEIDLILKSNRFRLNLLSGISEDFLDNVRGALNSELEIKGTLKEPIINGYLSFANFGFSVPMLGTSYNMEGVPRIKITPNRMEFDKMTLRDNLAKSAAELSGFISHKNFKDLRFKLVADADKFLALNTTASSGDMYYGTAFVSGQVKVEGPTDDLKMNIDVTTEKGTVFALPINNPAEASRAGFITFTDVNKDSTQALLSKTSQSNSTGITLVFNINVTPEAEAQLVMDERYNDIIKANGFGRIRLVVPPSGDITLNGRYELTRGEYNFSFQGLINKKFSIEPGSLIIFSGDPLAANIDITTKYTTRATLRGLLRDENLINTRTQIDLYLSITGQVMQPELSFEMKLPRATQIVQAEVNDIFTDQDRLTRQSFALLMFNSFITDDLSLGTAASNSTTIAYDALLSQVSSLLGQRLGNIDLQLNYSSVEFGANAENPEAIGSQRDFEIAVSKSFFNDRITVSGALDVPVDNNVANQRNDFAGDVEIDYALTPDGRIRAKAFNRSNQNRIDIVQVGDYTQGIGLSYRTNFDQFSQVFTSRRKKPNLVEEKIKEEDNGTEADDQSPKDIQGIKED